MNPKSRAKTTAVSFLVFAIGVLVLSGCGNSSSTTTAPTPAANNSLAVNAGFGPDGQSGGVPNELYTTITVCQPGTENCVTIPNILVDTGSIGLRLLPTALAGLSLSTITVDGNVLEECVQYGDTSYSWGPMALAKVEITGETDNDIPVQLVGDTNFAVPGNCLSTPIAPGTPNGGNEDTVFSLNANGILGIGNGASFGPWDCGEDCTSVEFGIGFPYYICPGGACSPVGVPTADQDVNPIAEFTSSDTNGMMIILPSVGTTGAPTVSGTINFGVSTQSDNALGSATVFAEDPCGFIPTVTFNGVGYDDTICTPADSGGMGGIFDTGSNALFVSDSSTLSFLGIYDCASTTAGFGFYCVTGGGTATLSNVGLFGYGNVGSEALSALNITDGTTLLKTNNAVFNNLGGESGGTGPSTDSFDFGLPFFIGRTVFIGITGASGTSSGSFAVTAPYGFAAF